MPLRAPFHAWLSRTNGWDTLRRIRVVRRPDARTKRDCGKRSRGGPVRFRPQTHAGPPVEDRWAVFVMGIAAVLLLWGKGLRIDDEPDAAYALAGRIPGFCVLEESIQGIAAKGHLLAAGRIQFAKVLGVESGRNGRPPDSQQRRPFGETVSGANGFAGAILGEVIQGHAFAVRKIQPESFFLHALDRLSLRLDRNGASDHYAQDKKQTEERVSGHYFSP